MSVDPDDRTPLAIKNTGADIITYGAPVLPGAMFLVSYLDGVPVCGLPGCVMYAKRTIFDLLLPRLLADDPIHRRGISPVWARAASAWAAPSATGPTAASDTAETLSAKAFRLCQLPRRGSLTKVKKV